MGNAQKRSKSRFWRPRGKLRPGQYFWPKRKGVAILSAAAMLIRTAQHAACGARGAPSRRPMRRNAGRRAPNLEMVKHFRRKKCLTNSQLPPELVTHIALQCNDTTDHKWLHCAGVEPFQPLSIDYILRNRLELDYKRVSFS